jgi:hypothetical protein
MAVNPVLAGANPKTGKVKPRAKGPNTKGVEGPIDLTRRTNPNTDGVEFNQKLPVQKLFDQYSENGKLRENPKIKIWGRELPFQGEDTYTYVSDKGETFGQLKVKFGLPNGVFKQLSGIPGDKDTYIISDIFPNGVKIPKAVLDEARGKK